MYRGTAPTTYEICVKCASAENVAAFRLIGQHNGNKNSATKFVANTFVVIFLSLLFLLLLLLRLFISCFLCATRAPCSLC